MSEINTFLRYLSMGYSTDTAYWKATKGGGPPRNRLEMPSNVTISVVPVPGTQRLSISNQHGTIVTRR